MQLDAAQLAALSAILTHGSFDAAAAALSVTPSAISQRLRALEDRVGTPLVLRTSPCTATQTGARLARHADERALLEAELASDLGQSSSPARVRIAVTADSLATWVLPALAATRGLIFDIVTDDQAHAAHWLRRGEVSAAITDHARPVQGCTAHPMGALRYIATCSPDFQARHFATGVSTATLAAAPMLRFNQKDGLQEQWMRQTFGQAVSAPTHHLPSSHGFVDACRLGLGWGMNPAPLVQQDLEQGRLVPLRADTALDVPLIWQVRRLVERPLVPVTRALRKAAQSHLQQ
ncbi:hypothetical protein P775_18010 [Puniceibacterium antarcticum]|uniref:HTH lysR-type domain-containing protein n=1 Tax=Puniceibacterium antarcticum TaxID=1206336 RepID=A0A2G8RAA8_9RHOB|nr:LysR family transcriptional regulator ArgP [Puniceibacterium antarcticum]PIL18469.1 hypothetical protein P775_18010 [Puniceibacterium antarcticum]